MCYVYGICIYIWEYKYMGVWCLLLKKHVMYVLMCMDKAQEVEVRRGGRGGNVDGGGAPTGGGAGGPPRPCRAIAARERLARSRALVYTLCIRPRRPVYNTQFWGLVCIRCIRICLVG